MHWRTSVASTGSILSRSTARDRSVGVVDGAAALLDRYRPVLVLETGHEGDGDREAIHRRLDALGYRMLGILLDYGMVEADWQTYVAIDPPFRANDAHNLLLVPE